MRTIGLIVLCCTVAACGWLLAKGINPLTWAYTKAIALKNKIVPSNTTATNSNMALKGKLLM